MSNTYQPDWLYLARQLNIAGLRLDKTFGYGKWNLEESYFIYITRLMLVIYSQMSEDARVYLPNINSYISCAKNGTTVSNEYFLSNIPDPKVRQYIKETAILNKIY